MEHSASCFSFSCLSLPRSIALIGAMVFSCFLSPTVQAVESGAPQIFSSVVCPQKTSLEGPTCCLQSQSQCDKAFAKIPVDVLERAETVRTGYFKGDFPYGRVPNCHWNAYSYLISTTMPLKPLSDWELFQLLEKTTREVPVEQMREGDVVGFFFKGKERVESERPGRGWVWVDAPETFEHSAIAVSGTLIFQKENVGSHVFSLADLEESRSAYAAEYFSRMRRLKGEIHVRVFRP